MESSTENLCFVSLFFAGVFPTSILWNLFPGIFPILILWNLSIPVLWAQWTQRLTCTSFNSVFLFSPSHLFSLHLFEMKAATPSSCFLVEQQLLSLEGIQGNPLCLVILCPALCTSYKHGWLSSWVSCSCASAIKPLAQSWATQSSRRSLILPSTRAVIWALFKRVSAGADQTLSLHFLLSAGTGRFTHFTMRGEDTAAAPGRAAIQPCCPFPILAPLFLGLFPHFPSSSAPDKAWRCKKRMTEIIVMKRP